MYRILHTGMTPNYGGVEAVVMNWYRNIDRTKIQFDFLTRHDGPLIAYEKEILDMGGRIYREYYGRKEKPFVASHYIQKIFEKDSTIKGVHMNLNSLEYITPLIIANKLKLPVKIAHSHNAGNLNGAEKIETRLMQKINTKLLQSFKYQKYGCSRVACDYMFGKNNGAVIHNAIELENFQYSEDKRKILRGKYGIQDNTFVIGFVGRIQYQKNPIFLIKIFKEYYKIDQNSKLVIVGDGALKDECVALTQKLGLAGKVLFLGMQEETADYYSMFDVFLLPSLFEGLGVVLVEAQANGLPCLVSDVIPSEVMITSLIEKQSLSDLPLLWAEHLIKMKKEKVQKRNENNYSEQIALAGYDIKKEVKRLENMYLSLIEGDRL